MDLLGIVGSRSVTDAGIEVAQQAARAAVQNRVGLVSGAARGVDEVGMDAALDAEDEGRRAPEQLSLHI